jgi:cytochrome c-type protein NapC
MILLATFVLTLGLAGVLVVKPSFGGKPFAFAALFVLPLIAALSSLGAHVEHSKTTAFCTSCHLMEPYGRSLRVDDTTLLPAVHFQNGSVPRQTACFTCHTSYTMYGDLAAKLRGLKHVWVQYLGKPPAKLKTYSPYHNRECLHCHDGTRRFEKGQTHRAEAGRMEKIKRNELSCIASGCHEFVHAADEVKDLPLWQPGGGT